MSSYRNDFFYRLQPVHMKNTVLIVSINKEVWYRSKFMKTTIKLGSSGYVFWMLARGSMAAFSFCWSFYIVKSRSPFITSKSSSKDLSNENNHTLCFQRIGILIHALPWRQENILLRFFYKFWRNKWRSVFDIVKDSSWCI